MNECNKTIVIPQYKMKIELKEGKQIIEFTPPESGVVPWSCWMGMIPGTFIVVDDVPSPKQDEAPAMPARRGEISCYRSLSATLCS